MANLAKSVLVAVVAALVVVSSAQLPPLPVARPPLFDAETHPWQISSANGLSELTGLQRFFFSAAVNVKSTLDDDSHREKLIADLLRVRILIGNFVRTRSPIVPFIPCIRAEVDSFLLVPTDHLSPKLVQNLKDLLVQIKNQQKTLLRADKQDAADRSAVYGIQVGMDSEPWADFQYVNLFYGSPESLPEKDGDRTRAATFLSASSVFASDSEPRFRIGAGFSTGDPNAWLVTSAVGTYTRLGVLDLGSKLSFRVFGREPIEPRTNDDHTYSKDYRKQRRVLDHVRPTDLWVDFGARLLVSGHSEFNAGAVEGGITYAVPCHTTNPNYPNLATAITIGGAYCAKRSIGVDEGSVEVRHPIFQTKPTFLTLRYGTRGGGSVGLLFRF